MTIEYTKFEIKYTAVNPDIKYLLSFAHACEINVFFLLLARSTWQQLCRKLLCVATSRCTRLWVANAIQNVTLVACVCDVALSWLFHRFISINKNDCLFAQWVSLLYHYCLWYIYSNTIFNKTLFLSAGC